MTSPLAGVWQLVSDSDDGIVIFSDFYFSVGVSEKNRAKFKMAEPTEAEAAKAFHAINTVAGKYELSGTTLVCHRIANRHPNSAGEDACFEITLVADQFTMKSDPSELGWVSQAVSNFGEHRTAVRLLLTATRRRAGTPK